MSESNLEPWDVWELEFPTTHGVAEKLCFLLRYAVLAPSSHNSQPWLWKMNGETVELHADRSRALPVADPDDRELIMGCGASLLHLRLALRHFGYAGEVATFPDPQNPDLLARVGLGPNKAPAVEDDLLFWAIPKRHTNRQPFEERELPISLLPALQAEAAQEGAWLHVIQDLAQRDAVVDLIVKGDWIQGHNRGFREELAHWIHPNRSAQSDGMPGYALGMNNLTSYVAPLAIKAMDIGEGQAEKDRRLAESAPVLAVLGTDETTPAHCLAAGQAVARVLLRACAAGVAASFFNQPIELNRLCTQLRHILERDGYPQLLFRLGYANETRPTPRRGVDEILIGEAALGEAAAGETLS